MRSDDTHLLEAIAHFLDGQVRGAVEDKALAFRVRIASHLLAAIARRVSSGEAQTREAIPRLAALLGEPPPVQPRTAREAEAMKKSLEAALAEQLRDAPSLDPRVVEALRGLLIEEITLAQPRFDTRLDIEGGEA